MTKCNAVSRNGELPCQKVVTSYGDHAGGHWFMSDDAWACLDAGHYDATDVLSGTAFQHLDIPCPRVVKSRTMEPNEIRDMTKEEVEEYFFGGDENTRRSVVCAIRMHVGASSLFNKYIKILQGLTAKEWDYLSENWGPTRCFQVAKMARNQPEDVIRGFDADIWQNILGLRIGAKAHRSVVGRHVATK